MQSGQKAFLKYLVVTIKIHFVSLLPHFMSMPDISELSQGVQINFLSHHTYHILYSKFHIDQKTILLMSLFLT